MEAVDQVRKPLSKEVATRFANEENASTWPPGARMRTVGHCPTPSPGDGVTGGAVMSVFFSTLCSESEQNIWQRRET